MSKRRVFVAAALVAPLLLGGCGTSSEKDGADGGKGGEKAPAEKTTRSITHALGTLNVPTAPKSVVALDEVAGLTLVSLGIKPKVVYKASAQPRAQEILEAEGVEVRDVTVGTLPSMEKLTVDGPDLMVGTGAAGPAGVGHKKLTKLAPTVVLPIEGTWREIVADTAGYFGKEEIGKRQIAATEALLKKPAEANKAEKGDQTLSLLGNSFGQNDFTMPPHVPISTLVSEAGFTRPAFQQRKVKGYSVPLSSEYLSEQDAELIVIPKGAYYDPAALQKKPTFKELKGKVVIPDADIWYGMSGFAFYASAHDLNTLASGQGELASKTTVQKVWKTYLSETTK
ncbi:ABC transporter substrate-binding protein [Streptomyces sp. NPDC020141]|uniref:ABC transporter substrate-binding protein n=1 Tax=Streptomyces sp. NPDC020141 TaxID=3365065 RepID=UPI003788544A